MYCSPATDEELPRRPARRGGSTVLADCPIAAGARLPTFFAIVLALAFCAGRRLPAGRGHYQRHHCDRSYTPLTERGRSGQAACRAVGGPLRGRAAGGDGGREQASRTGNATGRTAPRFG